MHGTGCSTGKMEGPTHCLTFLGIKVDTQAGALRLPQEKLGPIRSALRQWQHRKSCTKRELESLIGTLQHACRVVRPGKSFLRRTHPSPSDVRLNNHFRAGLGWWKVFASGWNDIAIVPPNDIPATTVTSEASGGCGTWYQSKWLQYQWPPHAQHHHIAYEELFAAILATASWGSEWRGQRVLWRCDNMAAVHAVLSRSCRDRSLMHLVRCLFFIEAHYQFELVASYLPGEANMLADDLSRNRSSAFLLKAPNKQ